MTDYQKKLERDRLDRLARLDPVKMMESMRMQGMKFTQTQMRTLVFDDAAQLERLLRSTPEVGGMFICMTRDAQGNAQL